LILERTVAVEREELRLRQTPPHAGFRELISGLYNSQCLLAPAALTLKRFCVFLYALLDDYLRFEWKRRLRCDP